MLGPALFFLVIILIAPSSRALIGVWMADAGKWMASWAPFSYILLMLLLIAPFVSLLIMHRWPKIPEPENPLAKYKNGEDVIYD